MTASRIRRAARLAAFAYLTSLIVVMASERVYWYWAGLTFESTATLALFYLIPTMAMLIAVAATPARKPHQVVLAGAVFAFVVEGVMTPVLYSDGPLPVMAALFVGWHGLISVVGFWYLARRLLLAGRLGAVVAGGAVVGALWGLWASVAALDPPAEAGTAAVLTPGEFTLYAVGVGAVLMVSHWLIGFVWPEKWEPAPRTVGVTVVVGVAYLGVAVLPTVPWAPLKLAMMLGGTTWLLRRSRSTVDAHHPTVLQALAGRIPLWRTSVMLALPVSAAITYAALWQIQIGAASMAAIYWTMVAAQVLAGAAAFVWAARGGLAPRRPARRVPTSSLPLRVP